MGRRTENWTISHIDFLVLMDPMCYDINTGHFGGEDGAGNGADAILY